MYCCTEQLGRLLRRARIAQALSTNRQDVPGGGQLCGHSCKAICCQLLVTPRYAFSLQTLSFNASAIQSTGHLLSVNFPNTQSAITQPSLHILTLLLSAPSQLVICGLQNAGLSSIKQTKSTLLPAAGEAKNRYMGASPTELLLNRYLRLWWTLLPMGSFPILSICNTCSRSHRLFLLQSYLVHNETVNIVRKLQPHGFSDYSSNLEQKTILFHLRIWIFGQLRTVFQFFHGYSFPFFQWFPHTIVYFSDDLKDGGQYDFNKENFISLKDSLVVVFLDLKLLL